ncbi:MAG TPA: hypothetical protein VFX60_18605 [Micromonospora sp.]|nr:hypothetical protein [Micromonospora sp.]
MRPANPCPEPDKRSIPGLLSLTFPCGDWSPDNKVATHTYTVTTLGGGPQKSKTITVTATVNEIVSA